MQEHTHLFVLVVKFFESGLNLKHVVRNEEGRFGGHHSGQYSNVWSGYSGQWFGGLLQRCSLFV